MPTATTETIPPGSWYYYGMCSDELTDDLAIIAEHGGAFDWLEDEPDIYTSEDGEAV